MKACKQYEELEIVTKTDRAHLQKLQNMVVLSAKLPLKVMHPNNPHEARNASTPRYRYSHVMREPTPTSNTIGVVFGTHIFLGPWGLASFLTQTNLFAKLQTCIRSKQNLARWPLRP